MTLSTQQSSTTCTPVQAPSSALDENKLAWLALSMSPGLGPKRILEAMKQLDAPQQIFTLPLTAMVLEVLRKDASLQIDEILDLVETQLTSSEVFTALFELEMAGRVRGLPGKNYVRTL